MHNKLAKKWMSQQTANNAEKLGVNIFIKKALLAAYPLNEHHITFVASIEHPKALADARFSQAMVGGAENLDELVRQHAKEVGREFGDMLYFPVFLDKKDTVSYSTNSRDKTFGGYLYFSKEMLRDWLKVKSIDAATRRKVKALAESVMIKLNKWSCGEVYDISIEKDGELLAESKGVYGLWLADRIVKNLLDEMATPQAI